MTDDRQASEGTLCVNFDEVTDIFTRLRPVVSQAANVQEFAQIIQGATSKIFSKYFGFPGSRLYKPEDLGLLVQHVMDCINNITPESIPYRSVSVDGQWRLYPKGKDDKSKSPKPS